jgi:hypothetical protein
MSSSELELDVSMDAKRSRSWRCVHVVLSSEWEGKGDEWGCGSMAEERVGEGGRPFEFQSRKGEPRERDR